MAEATIDLRHQPKDRAYAQLHGYILNVLGGIDDDVAGMATMSSPGCLEIQFGKGVCGTAAAQRKTVVVPEVDKFPGHIACDARSKSEIVVPVFDRSGGLIAVLDVDSEKRSTFDAADAQGLERIVAWFAGQGRG